MGKKGNKSDDDDYDPKDKDNLASKQSSTSQFHSAMRFDKSRALRERRFPNLGKSLLKTSSGFVLGKKGGRKNAGAVMGFEINSDKSSLSAVDYANRFFPKIAKHIHKNMLLLRKDKTPGSIKPGALEWLHLHGDNLGGRSEVGNFVAGSKASNTHMLAIESALAMYAHLNISISVQAFGPDTAHHLAQRIEYSVAVPSLSHLCKPRSVNLLKLTFVLDSLAPSCTADEFERLKSHMERWLSLADNLIHAAKSKNNLSPLFEKLKKVSGKYFVNTGNLLRLSPSS